jgi:C4-dicarboxylate-specific signal transduction histidine kinase
MERSSNAVITWSEVAGVTVFSSMALPQSSSLTWGPLLWLNASSDILIAASYLGIAAVLVYLSRRRNDVSIGWLILSFAGFILLCGATRMVDAITLWSPIFWVGANIKAINALAAVATLVYLIRKIPQLRAIPEANAVQRINDTLTSVLESTTAGVYAISRDGKIGYLNNNARRLLQVGKTITGMHYREAFPNQQASTVARLESVMQTREPADFESYYAPLDLSSTVHVHPWSDGGVTVFFQDVSRQKRLEQALEKERQLREQRMMALAQMASGLAHEISNPLGIIHARASDLSDTADEEPSVPSDVVRKTCTSIIGTADRAIRILRGLKMFSRDGASDPTDLFKLESVIDETIELMRSRLMKHAIRLQQDMEQPLPSISGHEVQISQILMNLMNNAVDAIDEANSPERWIRIRTTVALDKVYIDVIDSGPGIPAENREKLMQPFFTTKSGGSGIGIGLSLSKAIAADHGGSLDLLDMDEHTCFRLTLPVVPEEVEGARVATQSTYPVSG